MTGLVRKLTWSDFKGVEPESASMVAEARPTFSVSGASTKSVGKGPSMTWQLGDTITVAVTFDSANSWVSGSVSGLAQADKDALLKHEQGHYDLVALLARDMFIEMMQLKAESFSYSSEIGQKVTAIHTRYGNLAQPVQDLYDATAQTNNGKNKAKQIIWDGYINTAFTQVRASGGSTPGGTMYKAELIPLLKQNGLQI